MLDTVDVIGVSCGHRVATSLPLTCYCLWYLVLYHVYSGILLCLRPQLDSEFLGRKDFERTVFVCFLKAEVSAKHRGDTQYMPETGRKGQKGGQRKGGLRFLSKALIGE